MNPLMYFASIKCCECNVMRITTVNKFLWELARKDPEVVRHLFCSVTRLILRLPSACYANLDPIQ